jgi:glycosyltransferase involved in cell wall biosynthesis
MEPLVTIGIPTFNRLSYLKEAVESSLAQTYPNIEILIGDDGSNSKLRQWCQQQVLRNPKIRYQRNAHTVGLAGNWNALLAAATGNFIVIIGDDDRLLPEFVARCVNALSPDTSLIFSDHYIIDDAGRRLARETDLSSAKYGRNDLRPGIVTDAEACAWRNNIPISASLFNTDAGRRLRFKEDLNNPEIELFIRLAREGQNFVYLAERLVEYRTHAASATASEGLRSDVLIDYLIPVDVRPEIEDLKRQLIDQLIVNAVSRSLLAGNRPRAARLLASDYYPRNQGIDVTRLTQMLATSVPFVGSLVYRALLRLKKVLVDDT